jgi:hypothetical protein
MDSLSLEMMYLKNRMYYSIMDQGKYLFFEVNGRRDRFPDDDVGCKRDMR